MCNDLAKETNIHGTSFFISKDKPLNACAMSLFGTKKIFLDRTWLTVNTTDEVRLMKHIKAVIAHEFGHIALNHTHKKLAGFFTERIIDGGIAHYQEKAVVKNIESYANDVMRSPQKTEYDPKLQDHYSKAKECLMSPRFLREILPTGNTLILQKSLIARTRPGVF